MANKRDPAAIASINGLGRQFSDATVLMHAAIAGKAGLSGADHKYLGILIRQGPMTAGQLARSTGLTTGAVTGLVDRLEKKQLVKRSFDPNDRRKVLIIPDQQRAEKLLGGIFSALQRRTLDLLSAFNANELDVIKRYLSGAITIMNETTTELTTRKKK